MVRFRPCAAAEYIYDVSISQGEMVFGGCNDLVQLCRHFKRSRLAQWVSFQELMKNGDPDRLVAGGKMATIIVDRYVLQSMLHIKSLKS